MEKRLFVCCATYTDRQHRADFVHGIAVCPLADISDLISVPRQAQLLVHELGESPHAIGAPANTHKLEGEDTKRTDFSCSFISSFR